ncbi:hypothetical protein C9J01_08165 [Photobacterium rosenbergii]|uniref:Uncharacterized protein n=1 Tax=Photobacterium rosenbergii TaxID=294936 RepID=A0A2T3NHF0_9GAMM|nr:hypothetical protein C9J01_08165 [Photobacterium rosenbergii]
MYEFIEMAVPEGRPSEATHFNPRYRLCWEKLVEDSNNVQVYDHVHKSWGQPVYRPGGLLIQLQQ